MLKWLSARALSALFGDGFGADLAGRGIVYLGDGVREAIDRDEQPVTRASLRPGQTYTVIARPPATRRERHLAARRSALDAKVRSATAPSRSQLRAARRLARTQRRLDRSRTGSRRHRRLAERELRRGRKFDEATRPTRRQSKLTAELDLVTAELDAARTTSLARARDGLGRRGTRPRTTVYD